MTVMLFLKYDFRFNKANAILSKIRHYVDIKTLKLIYHAIVDRHLSYGLLVWAENSSSVKNHIFYIKIIHCFSQNKNAHTGPIFENSKF